jgi:WD40 repeat protein
MEVSHCGEFLVCGGEQGQVVVYIIQTLEVVRRYDGTGVSISSLTVTPEDCFLVGTQDGSLMVFSLEFQEQNKKGGLLASYQRHAR